MTPKQQWIRDRHNDSIEKNVALLTSVLNTESLAANPVPRAKVPKSVNLTQIVNALPSADVLLLNTQYSPVVAALIENINKGAIADVANLIRGLMASNLSQAAKDSINTEFQAIAASYQDPATYGVFDPDWQGQILASPAKLAGYGVIQANDIVEALAAN